MIRGVHILVNIRCIPVVVVWIRMDFVGSYIYKLREWNYLKRLGCVAVLWGYGLAGGNMLLGIGFEVSEA